MTAAGRRSGRIGAWRDKTGARPAAALVLVALLALATACGLGDRAEVAQHLIDSVERLDAAGPAGGTMVVSLRVIEIPAVAGGLAVGPGAVPGDAAPATAFGFEGAPIEVNIDVAAKRSALGAPGAPEQIFDGLVVYGHRVGAADGDARPWMKVDIAHLADGDSKVNFTQLPPEAVRNALNPSFVVDLIAGALSGSVERVDASDTVGGVSVTKYEANFDIEKAVENTRRDRYPEDDREAVYDLLRLLTVSGRVFPGAVWLDDDGRPRRFEIGLRVSPRKGFEFELELDLELASFGTEELAPVPTELELLETDSLGGFLHAVTPGFVVP